MADDALPPLPKPKYLDLIQPKPLNYYSEINNQEKQASSNPEASQAVASISKPSSSTAYTPGYQEQDRYQPEGGKWRLGRDIQTGDYVDAPQASRREGLYIIGIPGTGKTGLIENQIIQDIKQGMGVGLLDPHGDLINAVLARMDRREDDVILLDITDYRYPFGLNLFACSDLTNPIEVQKTVDQVMHIFERLFEVTRTTPLITQYLRNCTHTLIANPGYTMADIPLLLRNKDCRRKLVANVRDRNVLGFWQDYEDLKPSDQRAEREPILRRLEELLQPLTFNIVGQSTTTIDIRQVMDEGKILLVKLSAQLDSITSLIGSILVALFLNAAYSRADLPMNKRRQFNLYADEFQRFATEDFALLLTEARKFGMATTIAHQARYQPGMTDGIRATSLSVKNLVVFKVNSKDGDELAGEFDITPQEAWEEEIEPEQLEVREKERIETIEVMDGEEPIKVNERQIVDHLLKQGHEDERVMQFVRTYLQPLFLAIEKKPLERYEKPSQKFTAQKAFVDLNIWLYEGMVNPDKLFQPLPESVVGLTQLLTSTYIKEDDPFYMFWCLKGIYESYGYDTYNIEVVKAVRPATEEWQEKRMKAINQLREAVLTLSPQQSEDFYVLRRSLITQPQLISLYHNAVDKRSLYEADKKINKVMEEWKYEIKVSGWRNWGKIAGRDYGVEPQPNQSQSEFARMLVVEMRVKYLPEIMRAISEAYFSFERFSEAAGLCQYALWQNPLKTTGSGLYQPRKRQQIIVHPEKTFAHPRIAITHPQRTYADVHKQVASELTNLGNFMARVRYKNANERLVECTIRTLDPKQQLDKPLYRQALQERITTIKEQNIQYGYLRERAAIEEEIRTRQEQCSQPPEDKPPISRRPPR